MLLRLHTLSVIFANRRTLFYPVHPMPRYAVHVNKDIIVLLMLTLCNLSLSFASFNLTEAEPAVPLEKNLLGSDALFSNDSSCERADSLLSITSHMLSHKFRT